MAPVGFLVEETVLGGSKRKCLDDVSEDFSQFSLSSPARKMRRLDAFGAPVVIDEGLQNSIDSNLAQHPVELEGSATESNSFIPSCEERALVLYKPMNTSPLAGGLPGFSFQVDHDFIAQMKAKERDSWSDRLREECNTGEVDNTLAVVPWVPSRFPDGMGLQKQQLCSVETEDRAEDDAMSMDVDDKNVVDGGQIPDAAASGIGMQQWQQQHCMNVYPVVNASTPVMWSWSVS